MNAFQHILIPFDNSQSARVALRMAVKLSQRFSARLTMVYANPDDEVEAQVKEVIARVKERTGIEIYYLRPSGTVHTEIVEAAGSASADLIIMGTHGIGGMQELFIGSNAFRVVSSSPVPVLTMRESFEKKRLFRRILVPLDDSTESRQKLPMVKRVASYFDSEVHILATSKWDSDEVKSRVTRYAQQAIELLQEDEIDAKLHSLFGGNIANATMDLSDELDIDLIIAMSETEPSAGFFMGANAQRLINHSEIPVLTVHAREVVKGVAGY